MGSVAAPSSPSGSPSAVAQRLERIGRSAADRVAFFGLGASLAVESVRWLVRGRQLRQIVRAEHIVAEMMDIGVYAIPIVSVVSIAIGFTLSMQGIQGLEQFGAQHQVIGGVALGVTREFGPLITGIIVAGRSGSSLAARIGSMTISQEVDALKVMGINPVRFLVAPSLVAMLVVLPALTLWSIAIGLLASALYVTPVIGTTLGAFIAEVNAAISIDDLAHGLTKTLIFAVLITIVAAAKGTSVQGGAEGVGRVTRDSVVAGISAIIVSDLLFVYIMTQF
jgi:phospholipid/cholesterol/gamma-HCH transport system permease protein